MKLVAEIITTKELEEMSKNLFGDMVKAVIDIEKEIMAVDAELHADEESFLIKHGSTNNNLWGINLYPSFYSSDDFIEFDSMINLRPNQGNRTRSVENPEIRGKIIKIVNKLVQK